MRKITEKEKKSNLCKKCNVFRLKMQLTVYFFWYIMTIGGEDML